MSDMIPWSFVPFCIYLHSFNQYGVSVALGGVVISVLAAGPKVRGFKPGRG
jgi:hypothetical protein